MDFFREVRGIHQEYLAKVTEVERTAEQLRVTLERVLIEEIDKCVDRHSEALDVPANA
jgi:hypothetical protein